MKLSPRLHTQFDTNKTMYVSEKKNHFLDERLFKKRNREINCIA